MQCKYPKKYMYIFSDDMKWNDGERWEGDVFISTLFSAVRLVAKKGKILNIGDFLACSNLPGIKVREKFIEK